MSENRKEGMVILKLPKNGKKGGQERKRPKGGQRERKKCTESQNTHNKIAICKKNSSGASVAWCGLNHHCYGWALHGQLFRMCQMYRCLQQETNKAD